MPACGLTSMHSGPSSRHICAPTDTRSKRDLPVFACGGGRVLEAGRVHSPAMIRLRDGRPSDEDGLWTVTIATTESTFRGLVPDEQYQRMCAGVRDRNP